MLHASHFRLHAIALAVVLAGCKPVLEPPPAASPTPIPAIEPDRIGFDEPPVKEEALLLYMPAPTPVVPEAEKPTIVLPPPPPMTAVGKQLLLSTGGRSLVLEFETGGKSGYDPRPEAPDARISGVTVGIGYDCHYNSPGVIRIDWGLLGLPPANRLSTTHPYYGPSARAHLREFRDILIPWDVATQVFDHVDVAREFANAKRAVPGFEDLRPNAQAAWLSLGFNRGWGMSGANRLEMRTARDLAPKRDYEGMAIQFRKMIRVWRGTEIERGMTRRRLAEARLMETP